MGERVSAIDSIQGVMAKVNGVGKNSRNEQQNYKFRGIDAVVNAVGPALREVGGFITPTVLSTDYEPGVSAKGVRTVDARVTVEYTWHGTDGTSIASQVAAEARDTADKATAKAMSVAYRTYLLQILSLPTDEKDPDEDYIEQKAPRQEDVAVKAEWLEVIRGASTMAQLEAAWRGAGSAGLGKDREVLSATNERKAELQNAS